VAGEAGRLVTDVISDESIVGEGAPSTKTAHSATVTGGDPAKNQTERAAFYTGK